MDWADQREQLRALLSAEDYDAARRTTINAHYTDPAIVAEVWSTLGRLGFTGGTVLEPGSGAGTFIGMAPEGARMVGVELDGTTAAIARGLYPGAEIRTESFADTRFPRGHFDATVGNVPFADVSLHDPQHNRAGHSMHNHFIVKSLALTRPGGFVAVLTSSFTLDATNPAARREMNDLADLVGAVRLPSGTHRRSAGTETVTDLLILRRREQDRPPLDHAWETVTPRSVDGAKIRVNNYYDIHPEHVLGEFHVGQGMFGAETVSVRTEDIGAVPDQLRGALEGIVREASRQGLVFTEISEAAQERRLDAAATQTSLWDGTIVAVDGGFQVARGGALHALDVPKSQHVELRALLQLRDGARDLLNAEAAEPDDTPALAGRRAELHQAYDRYLAKYGPLNRFTLRGTGRFEPAVDDDGNPILDPATGRPAQGEERTARITPRTLVTFRQDPQSALVRALERFDEQDQTASPASLLLQRVVLPRATAQGAETPAEAIAISLDQTGAVDLELIADVLGVDQDEARTMLGDLVYDEPGTGAIIHAPDYLSGDVRAKLAAAEATAVSDARFQINVTALRAVVPAPIGIDEIDARLGSVWITPEVHQQFLQELLNDRSVRVENPLPGAWEVRGTRWGVLATNEWGTERRPATDIAQAVMEQRRLEVYDEVTDADGRVRRVLNPVDTTAAQEKAEAIQERFGEWVWQDPKRAAELSEVYNRRFNSIALRDYSDAGNYLTLPGLAATLTLRPHQRAAVARMIAEPAVGLFHQVGAGKTLEMIVGATEMKRMGLIRKPAIVVPNHMLEQFTREWLQAYPQARILAASTDDLTGDKRRLFVARAAANDWDAVILTQTAFKKIGLSPDFQSQYLAQQVVELRGALSHAQDEESLSVKRIEKRVLAMEERWKKSLDIPRDAGVNFEEMGVDYLVVDEAHMYKNLATVSNIQDAAIEGSQQATDLHMKLEWLRRTHGDRVATMATATPLANSITEAYVMQRYLRPDLLHAAGVTSFDGWAATFGTQVTEMEMGPAGGFRLKTRFAKFQNVPEMLRMWHVFADVKTAEDLHLPVPDIAARPSDGRRDVETVVLDPTPELERYITEIANRAEMVANKQVHPSEDNMLLISTDGRKAALDIRLVDGTVQPTGRVKLDAVAEQILTEWKATRDNEYLDEVTGQPSPRRGGMQMVFCDLGTPHPTRWDAYSELRSKLIAGGLAHDQVRFIHDAKNDQEKGRLFAAARAGHIAVLIGSTGKMGVGTNVQNRLTALHHVDCPWRPADLEQRDGRAIRQGNQNPEVAMFRYVVERSFDAYSWQTVGRKAKFIAQIMRGRLDSREIEDIGDTALSAAEAKALASGNPLVLEKATADAALQKLRRQHAAHQRAQAALNHIRADAQEKLTAADATLSQLNAAAARTTDVSGDAFRMVVDGRQVTSRTDAADAIAAWSQRNQVALLQARERRLTLGVIGGHSVTAHREDRISGPFLRPEAVIVLELDGVPHSSSTIAPRALAESSVGLVRTLENKTTAIAHSIQLEHAARAAAERNLAESARNLGKPFPRAAELEEAQRRADQIDQALAETTRPQAERSLRDLSFPVAASAPAAPLAPGSAQPRARIGPSRPGDRDRGLGR